MVDVVDRAVMKPTTPDHAQEMGHGREQDEPVNKNRIQILVFRSLKLQSNKTLNSQIRESRFPELGSCFSSSGS